MGGRGAHSILITVELAPGANSSVGRVLGSVYIDEIPSCGYLPLMNSRRTNVVSCGHVEDSG